MSKRGNSTSHKVSRSKLFFIPLYIFFKTISFSVKKIWNNCMLHLSFSPSWFSMQFTFLSRKTALQIILSFHVILVKILFHICKFHLLMHHGFRSVSHKLRAGLSAGHTKPFFPWCSVKWGRSRSSILPQFLVVYLPACAPASRLDCVSTQTVPTGPSARSPLDFLGPSVLLCHLGTSPTTIPHAPHHRAPVHIPSATQRTSQNPRTHFLGCEIIFTINLKRYFALSLQDTPHLLPSLMKIRNIRLQI